MKNELNTPFLKIQDAARVTGLSAYFIRAGAKNGTVPAVKCGTVWMVNVPALLRKLDAESEARG